MTLFYVIIGIGALFIGVGLMLTEKNAKYLLSGYNTMSEKDRAMVDLKNYIPFFKQFHLFLGASFILIGAALHYLYGETASGLFMGLYPIAAYIYFIWKSQEYTKAPARKWEKFAIGILSMVFIIVGGMFYQGYQELEFSYTSEEIVIDGMYGEVIPAENIRFISLVDSLPRIKYRKNGFSVGEINKGYYKLKDDSTIKLLLDSKQKPVIFIDLVEGSDIYYSSKSDSNNLLFEQLEQSMNSVTFVN